MGYFRDNRGRGNNFRRGGFGDRGPRRDREMFDAICSNCGRECQVPFRPTGDKPIYCSDCFEKMGGRNDRDNRRSERPRFENKAPRVDTQFKTQLDALNVKLDKIITLLETQQSAPKTTKASVVKKVKKAKEATKDLS